MSPKSRKKKRTGGRPPRRRPDPEYAQAVRQADEVLAVNDAEIRPDNWQELAVAWFAPFEPERTALTEYIARYEQDLGVPWARQVLRLEVFIQARDQEQVIAHYDWALASYPRCAAIELWVADAVFRDAGDFWRARRMYQYAAEHLPDHFKSYQELGYLSYLVGDFPGALAWYEEAAERVGGEDKEMGARILYNLGLMRYVADGDRAAAITDLEEALRRYPDYEEAKRMLRSLRRKEIRWVPW